MVALVLLIVIDHTNTAIAVFIFLHITIEHGASTLRNLHHPVITYQARVIGVFLHLRAIEEEDAVIVIALVYPILKLPNIANHFRE